MAIGKAGSCMGRSRGHNGSNERQSYGCGYANSSYGNATGEIPGGRHRFDKQMRVGQTLKGQLHNSFVYLRRELPRDDHRDLRCIVFPVTQLPYGCRSCIQAMALVALRIVDQDLVV
jgi:hypothetical protein